MERFKYLILTMLLASISFIGCGSQGFFPPGVITGDEAGDRITNAVNEGTLLCQIRTGRTPSVSLPMVLKPSIMAWAHIDSSRGYRIHDVDRCAQSIKAATSLDPFCSYLAWVCPLNPVNKITGSN